MPIRDSGGNLTVVLPQSLVVMQNPTPTNQWLSINIYDQSAVRVLPYLRSSRIDPDSIAGITGSGFGFIFALLWRYLKGDSMMIETTETQFHKMKKGGIYSFLSTLASVATGSYSRFLLLDERNHFYHLKIFLKHFLQDIDQIQLNELDFDVFLGVHNAKTNADGYITKERCPQMSVLHLCYLAMSSLDHYEQFDLQGKFKIPEIHTEEVGALTEEGVIFSHGSMGQIADSNLVMHSGYSKIALKSIFSQRMLASKHLKFPSHPMSSKAQIDHHDRVYNLQLGVQYSLLRQLQIETGSFDLEKIELEPTPFEMNMSRKTLRKHLSQKPN